MGVLLGDLVESAYILGEVERGDAGLGEIRFEDETDVPGGAGGGE